MGEKEREKDQKRKLKIDWNGVWENQEEEEMQEIEVIKKSKAPPEPSTSTSVPMEDQQDCERELTDHELDEQILRQGLLLNTMAPRLPDKGLKIRAKLKRLEDEKDRRTLLQGQTDYDGCENPSQLTSSGAFGGLRQGNTPSEDLSQSSFGTCFSKKMEEKTDHNVVKAFDQELQILGHESQKPKCNENLSERGRQKDQSASRQSQFRCPRKPSENGHKNIFSNSDHKRRVSSPHSLTVDDGFIKGFTEKKDAFPALASNNHRRRRGQTVINVDEEDPQLVTIEQAAKFPACMKETRIYYPSRDDPESVEICFKDIDCLAPEGYLTSPIMNFYIRYLQQQASQTNRALHDCHFFNTYFYKKLKDAVSYKGNDKDAFFVKFRRWWKGVNIFHKAYVLIPIHEDLHWSLVIICIPDKKDESGPIILHLDSLGFHSSRSIFDNIRRFLKAEWKYLNQEATPSDLPIANRVWKHLSQRIDEKIIAVPQQKNDYDCGLFVLFFMKRFIEEAPGRLKKKDLAMFGRQWFRPEEASGLRVKIRNLLAEQFQIVSKKSCSPESSVSSGSA